jgi:paraquat-inducible protein A
VLANSIPFITLQYGGITQTNRVFTGVSALWMDRQFFLSVLVGMTSIAIPGLQLTLACGLMLALKQGISGDKLRPLSRFLAFIAPGSMPGVYLVGAFVAAVKLSQLATLTPGPGLYCFGAFALFWVLGLGSLDLEAAIKDFRPRRSVR